MIRFTLALLGTFLLLGVVYSAAIGINHIKQPRPSALASPYKLTPLPETDIQRDTTTKNSDESLPAAVITTTSQPTATELNPPPLPPKNLLQYLEITTGCHLHLGSDCIKAYSRPTASSSERAQLRIGSVLLVGNSTTSSDGSLWYEIIFDEPLRYSERVKLPWYVQADSGIVHSETGIENISTTTPTTTKSLLADRSEQELYAYEGDTLVRTYTISTGLELSPTPRGTFIIYRKTPTRYMQGPIPGVNTKYYDLPGVPWNLYFTLQGAVVHGAYWHDSFGTRYSSGCVNVEPGEARELYEWADLGMSITVRD